MDKKRTIMLVLTDQDGLNVTTTLIDLKTALPIDKVKPAIEAACFDYLKTPEGRETWEHNCHCFNYGDFNLYVGNEFCEPHGFTKIEGDTFEILDDDFNSTLAELTSDNEGFMLDAPYEDIRVTGEDIDDIMESAMSGCTYWCERADVVGDYLGEYASEQISHGGSLTFVPFGPFEDEKKNLDSRKFMKGLNRWLCGLDNDRLQTVLAGGEIDPGQIDAADADVIIQYALFDDIIYG